MPTRRNEPDRPYEPHRLATQLRHARQLEGLTMRDMEEATGIASGHVSDIERGWVYSPRVNTMNRLGAPLKLKLAWVKRR